MNHNTLYIVKKLLEKKAIKMAFLLFALLYSLYEYLWGIWLPDSYYWINISQFWQDNAMTFLSLWGMDMWHDLFGRTLFANRILAWGINAATVLLAYLLFIDKKRREKYLYYLCGAFIIMGPGFSKCCTPESFTSLLLIFLTWWVLRYPSSNNKLLSIVAMSLLTAFVIAVRFPNIVCLVFVVAYLWVIASSRGKAIKASLLYLSLTLVLFWLVMWVCLGTSDGYGEIAQSLMNATGESNGRHSILGLVLRYCKSIILSLLAFVMLLVVWFTLRVLPIRFLLIKYTVLLLLGSILMYETFCRIGMGYHSWSVSVVGILASIFLLCAYNKWRHKDKSGTCQFLLLTAMLFVPSAGSDTGFFKSLVLSCALMPVALSTLSKLQYETYYIPVLLVVVIITSVLISNERFQYNVVTSKSEYLQHILLEKQQIKQYDELVKEIIPYYNNNQMVFYGSEAHYLYFVTKSMLLYNPGYWMNKNDTIAINRAVDAVNEIQSSILLDFTKSDTTIFQNRGIQLTEATKLFNVYSYK